jgi:hypothetical protein
MPTHIKPLETIMNIRKLINQLEEIAELAGDDQIVYTWCPDGEDWFPITGFTYGGGDNIIQIYNDEG